MNEFFSFLENILEMIWDNRPLRMILLMVSTIMWGAYSMIQVERSKQDKSQTQSLEQMDIETESLIEKQADFFELLRKNSKNNEISARVTTLAEKVKQIPEEKLEGSRLESYYLPELCSILKTHSSLPVSEKKDKEVFNAIEAVEDVVDTLLNDIQREKELTLDVDVKVLKQMAQADSEDDIFETSGRIGLRL